MKLFDLSAQTFVERVLDTGRAADIQPLRLDGNAQVAFRKMRQILDVKFSHPDKGELLNRKAPEELRVHVSHLIAQTESLDRPLLLHDPPVKRWRCVGSITSSPVVVVG